MGACSSTKVKLMNPQSLQNPRIAMSSARSQLNQMKTLAMKDIKGFKKSDTVENFYDIMETIGRGIVPIFSNNIGSFGEVLSAVHLLTNEKRAIKVIDKRKIMKHEVLMQLQ